MENSKAVLIVGATGSLGSEICRRLAEKGHEVKAFVRSASNPEKIERLREMGAEIVVGDLKDRASLKKAMEKVEAVISTASSTISRSEGDSIETVDRQGQLNLVEAAEEAGVRRIVFISFLPSTENFPLQDAKQEVEARIQSGKMQYTILRPTFYMDVWLSPHLGFDPANGTATIYGNGKNKISWISAGDVAQFAVASLTNENAKNKVIDLGGPEAISPLEVVRLFEEKKKNSITVTFVPEEALREQMSNANEPLQKSFFGLMLTYAAGAAVQMDDTKKKFNVDLVPVTSFFNLK